MCKLKRLPFFHTLIVGLSLLVLGFVFIYPSALAQQAAVSLAGPYNVHLPIITDRYDPNLGIPLFGVQTYQATHDNSPYHPFLLDSGARWIRVPISWGAIEPVNVEPDAYSWGSTDSLLVGATPEMGNFKLIVTISTAPEWAAEEPDGPINPINLPDFAQFVATLAERYDGDGLNDAPNSPIITYWEIYNEPDNNSDRSLPTFREPVHWGDHGAEYAQMLSVVYPSVKAANPQAQVVFGGVAHDWFVEDGGPFVRSFINNVLAAGGGAYFDVMNFHYYPAFKANWTTGPGIGLLEKTAVIRDILADYNVDKPFIITEAGWHDNNPPQAPSSPEIQSRYVVELFVQSISTDIDVMIWWMLYDPGGFYPYNNGLVTNASQPSPKPSFGTYQLLTQELSTAHFIRALPLSETGNENMEAYEFDDNIYNRTVYVAWLNPVDTELTSPLWVPAPQATLVDSQTGESTIVMDGTDGVLDGYVTVQVGGRPAYVEVYP